MKIKDGLKSRLIFIKSTYKVEINNIKHIMINMYLREGR